MHVRVRASCKPFAVASARCGTAGTSVAAPPVRRGACVPPRPVAGRTAPAVPRTAGLQLRHAAARAAVGAPSCPPGRPCCPGAGRCALAPRCRWSPSVSPGSRPPLSSPSSLTAPHAFRVPLKDPVWHVLAFPLPFITKAHFLPSTLPPPYAPSDESDALHASRRRAVSLFLSPPRLCDCNTKKCDSLPRGELIGAHTQKPGLPFRFFFFFVAFSGFLGIAHGLTASRGNRCCLFCVQNLRCLPDFPFLSPVIRPCQHHPFRALCCSGPRVSTTEPQGL